MDDDTHEQKLQGQQDGRVYPLGRALRRTWDADNHDTLGSDVTGLMIDLSKVPFEPAAAHPGSPATPAPAPPVNPPPRSAPAAPSILTRLGNLVGW